MKKTTIISWNVNGIRAAERKGFVSWLEKSEYDIVCVQETKVFDEGVLSEKLLAPDGYTAYFHCCKERKGYSGVAVYTKMKPLNVKIDFGKNLLSREGRVIELEFKEFTLLNIYFPNGGSGDERLKYKLQFYDEFYEYILSLKDAGKKVIFCGDVNTAHNEIDLSRPKENAGVSGFLPVERAWMDTLAPVGFHDSFRRLYPTEVKYSWWDMKTRARERNVGWRIDYFFVSENIADQVTDAFILTETEGSDHCPIGITVKGA
jgi:exodeoxyribonuclease-3